MAGNLRDYGIIEDAWFVVVETLKGPHLVGETIHTRTAFIPGPCGTNVRNDPPWIWEADDSRSAEDLRPVAVSDTWLIFGSDEQPYDIQANYSRPMNVRGDVFLNSVKEILQTKN